MTRLIARIAAACLVGLTATALAKTIEGGNRGRPRDGGTPDEVQCGTGADEAVVDSADIARAPQDCETLTRTPRQRGLSPLSPTNLRGHA